MIRLVLCRNEEIEKGHNKTKLLSATEKNSLNRSSASGAGGRYIWAAVEREDKQI
jgi:hypothetical protein